MEKTEQAAIRNSAGICRATGLVILKISGKDAYDVVEGICPADLYVGDGRILHTLFLREDAQPFADVYVCREGPDFLVIAEGPGEAALRRYIQESVEGSPDFELETISETHEALTVNGPFAWEVMAALVGPQVIGLPYLTFYRKGETLVFRAGKTGEFGYLLLDPKADCSSREAQVNALLEKFEASWVSQDALDQCGLENWFFNIRRDTTEGVTPLELQLQWRVSYRGTYVGSEALKQRRADGIKQRITSLVSEQSIQKGDPVRFGEQVIGHITNAGYSHTRGDYAATALLDLAYAHAGVDRYTAGGVPVRTVAPPLIDNQSLHVDPFEHAFDRRDEVNYLGQHP